MLFRPRIRRILRLLEKDDKRILYPLLFLYLIISTLSLWGIVAAKADSLERFEALYNRTETLLKYNGILASHQRFLIGSIADLCQELHGPSWSRCYFENTLSEEWSNFTRLNEA